MIKGISLLMISWKSFNELSVIQLKAKKVVTIWMEKDPFEWNLFLMAVMKESSSDSEPLTLINKTERVVKWNKYEGKKH